MLVKAFATYFILEALVVKGFEECCTKHPTIYLHGRNPGQDFTVKDSVSEQDCSEGCLNKPNCLASMLDNAEGKCFEFYQTPKQEYTSDDRHIAFLCRTRALQVCAKHVGLRTYVYNGEPDTYTSYNTGVSTDGTCVQKCKDMNEAQYGSIWDGTACFCFKTIPSAGYNSGLNSYMCSNRIVSCKAKNALGRQERACERFDRLRLYAGSSSVELVNAQVDHPNISEQQCEQLCLDDEDCLAVSYFKLNGGTCHLFNGGLPGQFPEPDSNYVSHLCA